MILTYTDYLAGLYTGKGRNSKLSDAVQYLHDCWRPEYLNTGAWLIYIYRNGLVHEYTPKTIQIDSKTKLSWKCGVSNNLKSEHLSVSHMCNYKGTDVYEFKLNAPQLVDDFIQAVQSFKLKLSTEPALLEKFIYGFDDFQKSEDFSSIKSGSYITATARSWLTSSINNCTKSNLIIP